MTTASLFPQSSAIFFDTDKPGQYAAHAVMMSMTGRLLGTHVLQSTDVETVHEFLKGNITTAGFSLNYGVTADGIVYEFMKKGKMGKRETAAAIAQYGIVEWHYSWCWASKTWNNADGQPANFIQIDLSPVQTTKTALSYRGLLY